MSAGRAVESRRAAIGQALSRIAPKIPRHERESVLDHALDSVGLARASPEMAAWLSLTAYIRHTFTEYEDLLAEGYDADSARFFVRDHMNEVLEGWGSPRRIEAEDGE